MNLDKYLKQEGGRQLSWLRMLSIARDIADAMVYIHDQNILHLDLRCANIMVLYFTIYHISGIGEYLIPILNDISSLPPSFSLILSIYLNRWTRKEGP